MEKRGKKETIESEFLKLSRIIAEGYGFDDLTAKLFSILYLETKDISLGELSKRTGYSLASVSNKMKLLEPLNIVQKIKKPGSRKLYFYMKKDVIELSKSMFEKMYSAEVVPAKEILPKIIKKYKNKKLSKSEKEKINIIIKYHKQILKIERIFLDFVKKLNEIQ